MLAQCIYFKMHFVLRSKYFCKKIIKILDKIHFTADMKIIPI